MIRQAEVARATLKHDVTVLKAKLDVPSRIRRSLKIHPSGWLLGSLVSGFAGSLLFRRSKPARGKKAARGEFLFSLIGLALTAARPLAKVWLSTQVKNYIMGRPTGYLVNRLVQRRPNPQSPI